jgi:hypothetical protein
VLRRAGGANLLEHLLDGLPHDPCKRLVQQIPEGQTKRISRVVHPCGVQTTTIIRHSSMPQILFEKGNFFGFSCLVVITNLLIISD